MIAAARLRYKAIGALAQTLPFRLLDSVSRPPFVVPIYHCISDHPPKHVQHLFPARSLREFERDMDFFLRFYRPMSIEDLVGSLDRDVGDERRGFIVSFDDGQREVFEQAAPILRRKGIPSILFLSSAFIDNRKLGWRHKASLLASLLGPSSEESKKKLLRLGYQESALLDEMAIELGVDFDEYLRRERPYLTTEQVRSLVADGVTVGAHSVDHPRYHELTLDEQLDQTRRSLQFVAERFGSQHSLFAVPFSDQLSRLFYQQLDRRTIVFGDVGFGFDRGRRLFARLGLEDHRRLTARETMNVALFSQIVRGRRHVR